MEYKLETTPGTLRNRARAYAAELRDRADRVEANFEIMTFGPGTPEFESALDAIEERDVVLADEDQGELAAEFGLNQDDDEYWEDDEDQDDEDE